MRSVALGALLLGLSASLLFPRPPWSQATAPVAVVLEHSVYPHDSAASVTLISHALTPLVVPDCGAVVTSVSRPLPVARAALALQTCATASGTLMPGDTVTFALPYLPSGRYWLALTLVMNRSDLPPLNLSSPGLVFTVQ